MVMTTEGDFKAKERGRCWVLVTNRVVPWLLVKTSAFAFH